MTDTKDKPTEPQPAEPATEGPALDPDLAAFAAELAVPNHLSPGGLTTVALPTSYTFSEKPKKSLFVWTYDDDRYTARVGTFRDETGLGGREGDLFIVSGAVATLLGNECRTAEVRVCNYRHARKILLWLLLDPIPDNEMSVVWAQSKRRCMEESTRGWVKVRRSETGSLYETVVPQVPDPEPPDWDDLLRGQPMIALMKKAFGDKFVRDPDHPVIKAYFGA
jgi:hypothetical protein